MICLKTLVKQTKKNYILYIHCFVMNFSSKPTLYLICHCLNYCRNLRPLMQISKDVICLPNAALKMERSKREIHDIKKKLCHCNHTYETFFFPFLLVSALVWKNYHISGVSTVHIFRRQIYPRILPLISRFVPSCKTENIMLFDWIWIRHNY